MRTTIAAVTALAGSLLLAPLMLGPTQAGGAPDLKNALSATHPGAVTLVRHGGGFAMGEGHMRGGHEFVGRGFGGARFAAHDFHHGFNHDHFRHFHNRRFFVSNVFIGGGYPYYYGDCYWLRRQAIITGSPYWWARYQACRGYY
jgi:hypothetical protein